MIRAMLAAALVAVACCSPAFGEPVMKADAAYGVRYAQERVVELPQDQATPYLTVFGQRGDPRVAEIVKWFDTNETLVGLKSQTKYRVVYTDDPAYAERYAPTMTALPCVRLISATGDGPFVEFAGSNLPLSSDALAKGLNTKAGQTECFRRKQNQVQPQPGPVDPTPSPLPPSPRPNPAPRKDRLPWILLGILAVAGGSLGAWKHFKTLYNVQMPKRLAA